MARDFAKQFYNSKLWKDTREFILKRDNYLCVRCGMPASDVHHITELTPENINDKNISLNPKNLECLCKACHNEEHNHFNYDCDNGFMFDEFGQLVRKKSMPPIDRKI